MCEPRSPLGPGFLRSPRSRPTVPNAAKTGSGVALRHGCGSSCPAASSSSMVTVSSTNKARRSSFLTPGLACWYAWAGFATKLSATSSASSRSVTSRSALRCKRSTAAAPASASFHRSARAACRAPESDADVARFYARVFDRGVSFYSLAFLRLCLFSPRNDYGFNDAEPQSHFYNTPIDHR